MRYLLVVLLACLFGSAVRAQSVSPSLYTTFTYTAYTVHDTTSGEPPIQVCGVGGSLTLQPTGRYKKRLSIVGPQGPVYFKQEGTFTLIGDSIRFSFTDRKGSDVQLGTYRFDPITRHLIIVIRGYPNGNRGVYELDASKPAVPPDTSKQARP